MPTEVFGPYPLTSARVLEIIPSETSLAAIATPASAQPSFPPLAVPSTNDLAFPAGVVERATAALRSGSHLILAGPPGTGKSTLAETLASEAVSGGIVASYEVLTATADWTTFDTIGGYMPNESGSGLVFEEGLVLRTIRQNSWCIIDELNRANIDRSIGALISLLSGSETGARINLPYRMSVTDAAGSRMEPVRIARDPSQPQSGFDAASATYVIGSSWRLIATMNTLDRSNLFPLTAAFARRFATVYVGSPAPDAALDALAIDDPKARGVYAILLAEQLTDRANPRPLGPAIVRDAWRYVLTRTGGGTPAVGQAATGTPPDLTQPLVESLELCVLPQYTGLDANEWAVLRDSLIEALVTGLADPQLSETRAALVLELNQKLRGIQGAD